MATNETQSCLCDKVYRVTHGSCEPTLKQLCQVISRRFEPEFLYQGQTVTEADAIDIATQMVIKADYPLLSGVGLLGIKNQQTAINLFRLLRGVVDPGSNQFSLARQGGAKATLGEIKKRSDYVVLLNCRIWEQHPRLFTLLTNSGSKRKLIWIGDELAESDRCDESIVVDSSRLEDLLLVAHAKLKGVRHRAQPFGDTNFRCSFPGDDNGEQIQSFMAELVSKKYVTFLYQFSQSPEFDVVSDLVVSLVKTLNSEARAVAVELPPMESSASQVLAWTTGFGGAVDVSCRIPKSYGSEYSSASLLNRQECDALVCFGEPFDLPDSLSQVSKALPRTVFSWGCESRLVDDGHKVLEVRNLCLSGDTYTRFDDLTFEVDEIGGSPNLKRFLKQLERNVKNRIEKLT